MVKEYWFTIYEMDEEFLKSGGMIDDLKVKARFMLGKKEFKTYLHKGEKLNFEGERKARDRLLLEKLPNGVDGIKEDYLDKDKYYISQSKKLYNFDNLFDYIIIVLSGLSMILQGILLLSLFL